MIVILIGTHSNDESIENLFHDLETALKLDSLVGDVEDVVSSFVIAKLKSPRGASSEVTFIPQN